MSEQDTTVVNEGVDSTTTPTVPSDSEVVNTPSTEEKDYRTLYENARAAIREKNQIIQELKKEEPVEEPTVPDDEGMRRFLATEADAYIARKAVTDPTFMEILPDIEAEMAKGVDVKTAEMRVQAKLFQEISRQINEAPKVVIPTQINTTAIPETAPNDVKFEDSDPLLAKAIKDIGV